MKHNKKLIIGIAVAFGIVVFALLYISEFRWEQRKRNAGTDAASLRSVIAEAYINIHSDPDFVNTATEEQPMEVPEKYYTYVESVQGHGRVYVYVYVDGSVDAYFGTPEKTVKYYV